MHGNVTKDEAKDMSEIILEEFKPDVPLPETIPQMLVAQLEDRKSYVYRFQEPNENNTNSCIANVYQAGPMELGPNAVIALLHHLLKEPAFNELRTNEQLGYIVHTSVKTNGDNVKGILFLIQSDSFDPIYMDGRIEVFIESLREKIETMTDEEFNSNIDAVCKTLREKEKNIGEESSKYWNVVVNRTYMFKRLRLIASEVEKTTKQQVLDFYDNFFKTDGSSRRKLSVQVFAKQHMETFDTPIPDGAVRIENTTEFKNTSSLFDVPEEVDLESYSEKEPSYIKNPV